MLGELLGAELVAVSRRHLAGVVVGDLQDPAGDLLVVTSHTTTPGAPKFAGFLQSRWGVFFLDCRNAWDYP